jgi:hypothetical protein
LLIGRHHLVALLSSFLIPIRTPPQPNQKPTTVALQAAAKGSMPAGNGRKVLAHYIKKLKEGGFPEKAADKQFADYTDRELDALFDLSTDEYDKMVEDAYNEVGACVVCVCVGEMEGWKQQQQRVLSHAHHRHLDIPPSPPKTQTNNNRSARSRCRRRRSRA